ncbi:uncharacterized protein Bfra_006366 [Botrytis fragariae]|uniref:Uncharacterized protein n=1 Tax=Botrytis fragariae TaxID=1964551 RepID=A0A8H6B529_9HELO|nr:uncharacterized protein Bfra_006366 [Botrytis fragariae]KAF5879162.1 hypothetical protein Bfra_006366 [Botrytis fragariae]
MLPPRRSPKPVEDYVRIFKQIHEQCTELVTLKVALHELNIMFDAFSFHDHLKNDLIATDWLYKQLQGMPFLKDIVIHFQVIDLKRRYHQGWIDKSREYEWNFKVTEYEYKGNKDEALYDITDAVTDLARMEDTRRDMQRGYYIKRQTSDGGFEIDYDLSYRAACRKIEEGLLQLA